jgi:hypothetical protein
VALAAALVGTASAQSLGDLAKKEAERRKAVKAPGKVYTNDSLSSSPSPIAPAAPAAPPPAPAAPGSASTQKAPDAAADKSKASETASADRKVQESAWRQRMQAAREALQRSQVLADALQSRINALTSDFTSRDDPAQRDIVAVDRQKALAELERVKTDIAKNTKAIEDLQTEARRAGVPPGWLR